ncbi:FGGY family carbohydrate kinase [Pseudomonadota bacterium]
METPLYLAIDQGGHASRAIVFNNHGDIVCQYESPIETFTPQTDWVEHSPEKVLESIWHAIQQVVKTLGAQANQIKAAGLATQRSSIVCWHKESGKALSPVLSWQDRRQLNWIKQFEAHNRFVHDKTGLFLSPHYGASKLRWCLDNIEDVSTACTANQLLAGPLASYLAFNLTIENTNAVDPANASRTLLWDIASQNWNPKLCKLFGVPMEILPTCSHSHNVFGHININQQKIPLQLITGDQPATLFAWGKPSNEQLYINIGTGAFIQRTTAAPTSCERLLTGIAYQDASSPIFTLEGTVNGAARALQWLKIKALESRLPTWLKEIESPPLFINTISGLGSPYWQPSLPASFICDSEPTPAEKSVAVMESIVFLIQRNIDEMEQTLPNANQIIVSGGLSQLDGLCQRLANLSGKNVLRPKVCEATAQGLAFLTAGQPDDWPTLQAQKTFTPVTDESLAKRYQSFGKHITRLIAEKK